MTEEALPSTTLNCTQCGGVLQPDEGQTFITCPYCSSTIFIDKSKVVFHWYLAPTLDEGKARSSLARWMAGNQTVKDLDKKSRLVSTSFECFPPWYFKRMTLSGKEEIHLELAAATSVSEVRGLKLPAGDLRNYDDSLSSEAHPPSVPLETALSWLGERQISREEIVETALVHIPLFTMKYTFQGRVFTALVDAATGRVLANIFPEKAEIPYRLVGGVVAVTFLCLATIPMFGALVDGGAGFTLGMFVCAGLGTPLALVFMGVAAWVASKV
jgi:DNA-directed RNA polymerase subunit RPC12/RpoP